MAYIPALNDKFQVSAYCHAGGQASVSSWFVEVTASVGIGNVTDQDVVADLSAAFADLFKAVLGTGARYDGATFRQVDAVGPAPITKFSTAGNGAGLAGADLIPLQATGLISWHTEFGGKKNRGRTYIPFPCTADDINPGEPTADYVNRLDDFGTFITTPRVVTVLLHSTTFTFGLWSRAVPTPHVTPITTWVSHKAWATQKRRGAYGRLNKGPF